MRFRFITIALLVPLLGLTPAGARAAPRSYTHHAASTGTPEIVTLQIDNSFAAVDGANVLRAVEEWNQALNGWIRFEVLPPKGWQPRSWVIRAERGGQPETQDGAGQPLSFTQAGFASIGGRMVIYVDRIGTRDLRGVVLHELGHVLGLDHDTRSNLMSMRYSPTTEQCIDEETISRVAALRHLPVASLNWCAPDVLN